MKFLVILPALLIFTIHCQLLPQIIADLNSDRQTLLEFAAAVPHLRNFGWNYSIPVCTWFGITCSNDGNRVIAIRLPGVGLYGPLPANSIAKLDALKVLSLRSNHLIGKIPSNIFSMPSLQYLYLHDNNFSGEIPVEFSPQFSVIDLSFNSLSGEIPSGLSNLTRLFTLNLQFNFFTGPIPDLSIPKLKNLNLSHNLLNGSIPDILKKFPASSFIGNSRLCGPPLAKCFALSPAQSPLSDYLPPSPKHGAAFSRKLNAGAIAAIVIGGCSIVFLAVLAIVFCCLKKKKDSNGSVEKKPKLIIDNGKNVKSDDFGSGVPESEKNKLVFFEGCSYNFNLEDLLRASAEVLGKGSYGTTYKAILDEATMVVVKRLRETTISKKDFEQHMEILKTVGQHPSIVPLRAYYCSKDEKLLVYEYMPAGSFSAALHDNRGRTSLDWDTRLRISLGVAKGISHIHSSCGAKFVHGNIKASNVLLTEDLDGRVSDLGLYPLMNFLAVKSRGVGYYAPEVIETRKVTQKSDVYSYGVLLLEMLTGKSPVNASGLDYVIDLPRWVRSVVREEWTAEVFDAELLKYQNVEDEMVQMLQIALSCVAKVPDSRPTIDEVVQMMEDARLSEMENRTSSEDNRSKSSNVHTPIE